MKSIKDRLKEPSTHAGLAAMVGGVGMILHSPETTQLAHALPSVAEKVASHDFLGAVIALFGAVAFLLPERK